MTIQGLRDTSNFVTDQRPKSWREGLMLLAPNGSAPLFAMTSLMKKRMVDDAEYNWWEKNLPTRRLLMVEAAGLGTADTDINVAAGALQLKGGDLILLEETGEIIRVTSDPTVDTIIPVVVRDFPGLSNEAIIDTDATGVNPYMYVLGSTYEEGSDAPTGINFDSTKVNNYTQIFRDTLEITRTAANTKLRDQEAVKEARRECLELHSLSIEKSLWRGAKVETTVNGKPVRMTHGIEQFIHTDNVIDHLGAVTTLADIEAWLEQAFRYGSSQKMAFTGNVGLLNINTAIRKNSTYHITTGEKEFGMNVTKMVCPFGELVIKVHPLFNQITGGTNTTEYWSQNSWMFILDMAEMTYVHLKGGDTQFQQKLQSNGLDSIKSGYLTECGLEFHHPLSHMLIKHMGAGDTDA